MSGHSKWSQIKHQKGKTDQLRGQTFTKLSNAITIAVREGGGITDPASNFKLRLYIEKARSANMPKSNIDRAIERGLGKGEGAELEEITYEGFGPGKVAILVTATTDNRQRTNANLKNLFAEFGGILSGKGSVSYMFKHCGEVRVKKGKMTEDQFMELALEVGALDVEAFDDTVIFYTDTGTLHQIKEEIEKKGMKIIDSELIYKPTLTVKIEDRGTAKRIIDLISRLEEDNDIQKVSANYEIPKNIFL